MRVPMRGVVHSSALALCTPVCAHGGHTLCYTHSFTERGLLNPPMIGRYKSWTLDWTNGGMGF